MLEKFENVLDKISPKSISDRVELPNPQNERLPCLLLLDTSDSMNDPRFQPKNIDKLNQGLLEFKSALEGLEPYIRNAVDIAIITFGPDVKTIQDFESFSTFNPPVLSASGITPMKAAIEKGFEMIKQRKAYYRDNELLYKRPWIFLISDGLPTDMEEGDTNWTNLNQRIVDDEKGKHYAFFAFGVTEDSTRALQSLTSGSQMPAAYIIGANYKDFFLWLSATVEAGVKAPTGEKLILAPSDKFQYEVST